LYWWLLLGFGVASWNNPWCAGPPPCHILYVQIQVELQPLRVFLCFAYLHVHTPAGGSEVYTIDGLIDGSIDGLIDGLIHH
jgi:hypothetical protein